jgi:arylsulfatase A-like enzyme
MYGPEDLVPVNRDEREKIDPHPVYAAYMRHIESETFSRDEVRNAVMPVYMGLIKQIDDHLLRLWRFMEARGLFDNTMIVVTSDHGDYLGDHWLGEKELFHDVSARIPLVLYDPDPAADATRGRVVADLVEAIDLAPTFVAAYEGPDLSHVFEGRSLLPLVRGGGNGAPWREAVVSELDYSFRRARIDLDVTPGRAHAYMLRTDDWKYVLFEGFRPQLFDLRADPRELDDRGADPALEAVRNEMHERLFEWARSRKPRITYSDTQVIERTGAPRKRGIIIGEW